MQRFVLRVTPLFLLVASGASVALVCGCTTDDIGKRCEAKPTPVIASEPVGGEHPTNEIVAVQRNGSCESFECLSHRGYPAYCTRACAYDTKTAKGECTTNADCTRPLHCYLGQCQDDDCPSGFECRPVQTVGPLAGQLFCVQKENCAGNFDCESLGHVDCKKLACFDALWLENKKPDGSGTLTCSTREDVPYCQCPADQQASGVDSCLHPRCDPEDANAWDINATEFRDVCVRRP